MTSSITNKRRRIHFSFSSNKRNARAFSERTFIFFFFLVIFNVRSQFLTTHAHHKARSTNKQLHIAMYVIRQNKCHFNDEQKCRCFAVRRLCDPNHTCSNYNGRNSPRPFIAPSFAAAPLTRCGCPSVKRCEQCSDWPLVWRQMEKGRPIEAMGTITRR